MEVQGRAAKTLVPAGLARLHLRLANMNPRAESRVILLGCLFTALAFTLPLVAPGRTVSFKYVHDLMIFFDGAHRVLDGQFPNRDFHTPLGLVAYLLPAFGLWLGGSLGGMMPLATAAFVLIFLPMLVHVCASRLPLLYAALFALFALGLIVTPGSIGETMPSFGMFYNRWGYALLALLFLLAAPQERGRRRNWADAMVGGAVLLLTFYLKISYFAVAAGFTLLLLLFRDQRRIAILAIAIAAAGIGLVHLFWLGTAAYLADIGTAAQVSGAVRASLLGLIRMALDNAGMIVPFLIALGIAIARGAVLRTLFLCLVMAGAGLLLYNQNFQGPGMMTLVPAAILAGLAIPRPAGSADPLRLTALLLVAVLALPTAIFAAQTIFMHGYLAMRGGDPREYVAEIDGFLAQEGGRPAPGDVGFEDSRRAYRSGGADLNMLKVIRSQALRQVLAQPEYFWTVQDGVRLLRETPGLTGKVLTLDMANPLNAVAGRSAPRGIDSWYHAARTFNERTYRAADEMFADVDVVMVPVAPVDPTSHLLLSRLYGSHIQRHYALVASSDYWRAYARTGQ
jgi:hypothetical protein